MRCKDRNVRESFAEGGHHCLLRTMVNGKMDANCFRLRKENFGKFEKLVLKPEDRDKEKARRLSSTKFAVYACSEYGSKVMQSGRKDSNKDPTRIQLSQRLIQIVDLFRSVPSNKCENIKIGMETY